MTDVHLCRILIVCIWCMRLWHHLIILGSSRIIGFIFSFFIGDGRFISIHLKPKFFHKTVYFLFSSSKLSLTVNCLCQLLVKKWRWRLSQISLWIIPSFLCLLGLSLCLALFRNFIILRIWIRAGIPYEKLLYPLLLIVFLIVSTAMTPLASFTFTLV